MPPGPARTAPHVPALDGLRGAAILLVLGHHLFQGQLGRSPALDPLVRALGYGWCGVDMFFALSGFLITGILLKARGQPHFFRNFYARRTLRIFPLYYGCLSAILVVLPAAGVVLERTPAPPSEAWQWFYGTNLLVALQGSWNTGLVLFPFAHFWSLAVEEHFYLVWPLLVCFTAPRQLGALCLALIVGAGLLRTGYFFSTHDWIASYVWTPFRIDTLALGSLAAVLLAQTPDRAALRIRAARALWVCGALLVLAIATGHAARDDRFVPAAGFSLLAAFFAALVLSTALSPATHPLARFLSTPVLRFFGRYSYGLYVFHVFVLARIEAVNRHFDFSLGLRSPAAELLVSRGLVLGATVAAAFASWHLFEKHFLTLKARFA